MAHVMRSQATASSARACTDKVVELFVYSLTQHPGLIVATHLCVGALFMWAIEGWTPGSAIYFCILTLTTVGYGDVSPITPLGKFLAALVALGGIGLVAMPTGIIAAAFSDAMQRHRQRAAALRQVNDHQD